MPRIIRSPEERFWQYVEKEGYCWNWTGAITTWGYGTLMMPNNKKKAAHRLSYEIHHGDIPDGQLVRHKCDNPKCVNPFHLELGTPADNRRDAAIRNRIPLKLSDDQVDAVKSDGRMYKQIAASYGISAALVCLLKKGQRRTIRRVNCLDR